MTKKTIQRIAAGVLVAVCSLGAVVLPAGSASAGDTAWPGFSASDKVKK